MTDDPEKLDELEQATLTLLQFIPDENSRARVYEAFYIASMRFRNAAKDAGLIPKDR